MSTRLSDEIAERMGAKTTEELLSIWTKNDRTEWSDQAFEAVRHILQDRGVAIPQQESQCWQAPDSRLTLKCHQCGQWHAPGTARCSNCKQTLRPALLAIITLLGSVLSVLLAIFHGLSGHFVLLGIELAALVVFLSLRAGQLWGWILVQVLFAFLLLQYIVILRVVLHFDSKLPHGARIGSMVFMALVFLVFCLPALVSWIYIYSKKVRVFCSIGKSE